MHTKRWNIDWITTIPVTSKNFYGRAWKHASSEIKAEVQNWNGRHYVEDTFVYRRNDSIEYALSKLETFHPNIKFTCEKEVDDALPFLDVMFIRNSDHVHTTVYRKETNKDLYLHWHAFAPVSWKCGTLRSLVNRAYITCFKNNYLQQKLKNLHHMFHTQNDYQVWIIKQIMKEVISFFGQEFFDLNKALIRKKEDISYYTDWHTSIKH